jgi:hypothetical protein
VRRTLTISLLLVLFAVVGFSMLPSGTLLREAKAQTTPTITITAVDGNNAPVSNGATTSSNSITFTFSSNVPVSDFICQIDTEPGGGCPSTLTINNITPGPHKISVGALGVPPAGNLGVEADFSWTVSGPTGTTITAVDGNGVPIKNESTTSSNSITFTYFHGTPVSGFICGLDSPGGGCPGITGSPGIITFNNLSPGQHIFSVGALSLPSPTNEVHVLDVTVFIWTVHPNPIQGTQDLIQLKQSMNLASVTDQILDNQLDSALKSFQSGNNGGCGHLSGFVSQVQELLQAGSLTQVQANQLLKGAQSVEKIAGC